MPSAVNTINTTLHNQNPTLTSPRNTSTIARRASLKTLSRNIDKVVLGNLLFDTWYYSPYPDSVVLGADHQHQHPSQQDVSGLNSTNTRHASNVVEAKSGPRVSSGTGPETSTTTTSTTSTITNGIPGKTETPSCAVLHVCPYCFRYTRDLPSYTTHLHLHLSSVTLKSSSSSSSTLSRQTKSSFLPVPSTATKVYSHAGYTVYDIDGEVEKLYCQNLSLFGKLFLEQKSVFFDTAGFHYFVLTHTREDGDVGGYDDEISRSNDGVGVSGTTTIGRTRRRSSAANNNSKVKVEAGTKASPKRGLKTQVLGFFSKENLSWDSNNLACILVFPPFQHRNLGQLLMAVSYKLSGWEWEDSIIGGPEKPLSAMGKKSYLRFWSERIARFMMGTTNDADGTKVFEDARGRKRKGLKGGWRKEEMSVREIGERTGMLGEDVVAALSEMGVCEVMPVPKKRKIRKVDISAEETGVGGGGGIGGSGAAAASNNDRQEDAAAGDGDHGITMMVSREKVLEWARIRGVDLASPVKEEGFLGEWALSEAASDESEERVEGSEEE